jgi:hypothetical protein
MRVDRWHAHQHGDQTFIDQFRVLGVEELKA